LYECDDAGKFYSKLTGQQRKNVVNSYGYEQITLSRGGVSKTFRAHKLLATAFLDNPCKYTEINHKDGNKCNNVLSNLEWCSRKQNAEHAVRAGLYPTAERMPHCAVTEVQLMEAWNAIQKGAGVLHTAEKIGCSSVTLHRRFKKQYGRQPLTLSEARRRGGLKAKGEENGSN
jgi:hypothetical protein